MWGATLKVTDDPKTAPRTVIVGRTHQLVLLVKILQEGVASTLQSKLVRFGWSLKGELQCKKTLSGVKEGQKIRIFLVLVFCVDP